MLWECLAYRAWSMDEERGCGWMDGWTGPKGYDETTSKMPNWVHTFTGKVWKILRSNRVKILKQKKAFLPFIVASPDPCVSLQKGSFS